MFRALLVGKGLLYMLRKGALPEFLRNRKMAEASGAPSAEHGPKDDVRAEDQSLPDKRRRPRKFSRKSSSLIGRAGRWWTSWKRNSPGQVCYSNDMYEFMLAIPATRRAR